jgi:hypothetical protein
MPGKKKQLKTPPKKTSKKTVRACKKPVEMKPMIEPPAQPL